MSEEVIFSLKITPDEEFRSMIENIVGKKGVGGGKGGLSKQDLSVLTYEIGKIKSITTVLSDKVEYKLSGFENKFIGIQDALNEISGKISMINIATDSNARMVQYFMEIAEDAENRINDITNRAVQNMNTRSLNAIIRGYSDVFQSQNFAEILKRVIEGLFMRAATAIQSGDMGIVKRIYDIIGKAERGEILMRDFERMIKLWLGGEHNVITRSVFGKAVENYTAVGAGGVLATNAHDFLVRYLRENRGDLSEDVLQKFTYVLRDISQEGGNIEQIAIPEDALEEITKITAEAVSTGVIPDEDEIRSRILGEGAQPLPSNVVISNAMKLPRFITEALYGSQNIPVNPASPDVGMFLKLDDLTRRRLESIFSDETERLETRLAAFKDILRASLGDVVTDEFVKSMFDYLSKNERLRRRLIETGMYLEEGKLTIENKKFLEMEATKGFGISSLKKPTGREERVRPLIQPREELSPQTLERIAYVLEEALNDIREAINSNQAGEAGEEEEDMLDPTRLRRE